MPFGVSNPTDAPVSNGVASYSQNANAGVYLEERLSVGDRLFINGAIRQDAGSALGQSAKTPIFPKVDLSWIALQSPVQIPGIGVLNTVRLRTAHGQSGHQPTLSQLNAGIDRGTAWYDGANHPAFTYESLGNAYINPERTREMEFGVDMDFLGIIEALSVTYFRHVTTDALIPRRVSIESGLPDLNRIENLGKLQNTGVEATASFRLVDNRTATWTLNVGFSETRNKVLSLGQYSMTDPTGFITVRVVEGYPLFGLWAKPIYGYEDRNHDGALADDEIVIGDSLEYAGWGQPKYTMTYHSSVGLFRGNVRLSSSFSQNGGITRYARLTQAGQAAGDLQGQVLDKTLLRGLQTVSSLVWNSADVTVQIPQWVVQRLRARSGSLSVTGTNLYQWTNFRGNDPNVGPIGADQVITDSGITPNTRNWALRFTITY
jgi:hypothetical protein